MYRENTSPRARRPRRPRRTGLALVPALAALALTVPAAAPAAAEPEQQTRTVNGTLRIEINDDESGSDEHCDQTFPVLVKVRTDSSTPETRSQSRGCGDEIRVEVDSRYLAASDGKVSVSGVVRFYEGTSESTDDLDGTGDFTFVIAPSGVTSHNVHVWNTDEDVSGDWTTVTFDLRNDS